MTRREIDLEIQKKNYQKELLLCQKAGGDIDRYRRLSFDVLQLEQIRRGLESGVDVEVYLDPHKSWLEMEETRVSMETGFDMGKYIDQGFDWMQCNEIRAGIQAGVSVAKYLDVSYLAAQMKEIRKGLQQKLDVSQYASPQFDWFQMKEIRLGLEKKMNVSIFAKPEYTYTTMRAIRLGLADGINLIPFIEKGYTGTILNEISRGIRMNYDISEYLKQGYDAEQLRQINNAHEYGVNLVPYLRKGIHGVQLQEIITGLKEGLDVSRYADIRFNWFQMREIRYGLERKVDVSIYASPDFTAKQMEVIRKGLLEGLDVTKYAKIYFEPEQMEDIRHELGESNDEFSEEIERLLQDSLEEKETLVKPVETKQEETTDEDYVFNPCVNVSEDKMTVTMDFSLVSGEMQEKLEALTVPALIRLLRHNDVRQGVLSDRIRAIVEHKQFNKSVVVAEGKAAVNGEDGKFTFYFRKELNRKPRVLQDGSVDYKSMELFEVVKKDMLLAEYQPATQGVQGFDVTGRMIAPKQGKELPPLTGEGFMMTEDKKQYYSLLDGIVELDTYNHKLIVRNLYIVPGDVDASVGNIDFNGDINILGNVHSGFTITATGSVVIDGHCEGCQIEAGKDVIIRKGCQGKGIGRIVSGGEIMGKFFESATLEAEGDVEASYLLNCELRTQGKLLVEGRRGVIIGGYTCAKQGVSCFGVGNIAEIKTVVEVGIDKDDMMEYQELVKMIDKVDAELKTCESALHKLMEKPSRDEKSTEFLARLTKAVYTQKKQKKDLVKEQSVKMDKMTKQRGARVRVSGRAFPGTLLYLNTVPLALKEAFYNVDFVAQDNRVDMIPR